MVAMRRDVLQSRGWEGVWGHRADMLLVSGSQQSLHASSSDDNTRWHCCLSGLSAGRRNGDLSSPPSPTSYPWVWPQTILLLMCLG